MFSKNIENVLFNATIIFSRFTIEIFLFPFSTLAIYVLSSPAANANFSWLNPLSFLSSRIRAPTFCFIIASIPHLLITTLYLWYSPDDYKSTDYTSRPRMCQQFSERIIWNRLFRKRSSASSC